MRSQELVEYVKNPKRKNGINIEITDKGEELYHQSMDLKTIADTLSDLSEEEQNCLKETLIKVRNNAFPKIGIKQPFLFP